MSDNSSSGEIVLADAVEELLRQLVDARFVLTDREGSITRWSRPAEELFGWPGPRILGLPLLETLAVPGEAPTSGGQLRTVARHKDGSEVEVTLSLVPVRMSQSLEFNGFLEALAIAAPRGSALDRLQQSHRGVVDWISAAVAGDARLEEGELSAGTIVVFRSLVEPPSTVAGDEEHAGPAIDPGAAAAGQIAELQELGGQLGAELADTQRALEEMGQQVEALRSQLQDSSSSTAEQVQAERERIERAVDETRTFIEGLRTEVAGAPKAQERLGSEIQDIRAKLAALEEMLSGRHAEQLQSELAQVRAEIAALDGDAAEKRLRGDLDELREEIAALRARVVDEPAAAARSQAARAEELAASVGAEFERSQRIAESVREKAVQIEQAATAAEARIQAAVERQGKRAEEAVTAAEQSAASARESASVSQYAAENVRASLLMNESSSTSVDLVWANGGRPEGADHDPHRPLFGRKHPSLPARERRPGFDDAQNPMATIALDGHFRDLNPSFTELVGFAEQDFRAATWPPVTDRSNLSRHREEMRRMLAAEIDAAEVNTGYVHAQGLLVPVVGRLSLIRENDEPSHFLLEARAP